MSSESSTPADSASHPRARRFHLAVDDGGEFLVAAGERITLGHVRAEFADLPFLADVEREHAHFALHASFHGGDRWRIRAAHERAQLVVRGVRAGAESIELSDGDRVELARNLACIFRAPDPASSSALLELERGAECLGAARVLLLAAGRAGRVRIGSRRARLVPVAGLEHDVAFELAGADVMFACAGGLACGAVHVAAAPGATLTVALPERAPVFVTAGARAGAGPPFTLVLGPADDNPRAARGGPA